MTQDIRNVFISHIHEDEANVFALKDLLAEYGMICRNYSITTDKFNNAANPDYIKYKILAPHINWASILIVCISPETEYSKWVDWEIEYAHKKGKRIIGVWERGSTGWDLPEALQRYADAVVGWNGKSVIDAIHGDSNKTDNNRSVQKAAEPDSDLTGFLVAAGIVLGAIVLRRLLKPKQIEAEWPPRVGMRYP